MKKEDDELNELFRFGEFVCSEFVWLPMERQKRQAEKMSEITKTNIKER